MAITLEQYVADFLRDAQYRMAEIGVTLDALPDKDAPEYKKLNEYRLELYLFMDVLYIGYWDIKDGYNHLDWDEHDIKAEAEYLRNRTGMITSPFTTFVGLYPSIVESITGSSSGSALPAGSGGQFILYDDNGDPFLTSFPLAVGMVNGDTPSSYFS